MFGASQQSTNTEELNDIEGMLKNLKRSKENEEINILLLGETGVGKSTFINAFFNYITSSSIYKARNKRVQVVIPTKFTVTDDNFEERVVQLGRDCNESVEVGQSATQTCRSYVYPIEEGGLKIRFIDTPGVGDTRGIEQDNINFENVLSCIGEFKRLHAICILQKPNNTRLSVMFEFCIKQLLSRLEKSASQNIIFVFTNTRSTFYRPGETLPSLRKLLTTIGVEIPCGKDNIFCTDNESYRFLVALKNGVQFSSSDVYNYSQSWVHSSGECIRLLSYIIGDGDKMGLVPHEAKNTMSINEARSHIIQLSKPLAEITQLIQDNIRALDTHRENLKSATQTLSELRENLYIPVIDLKVTRLNEPTTVCTSTRCSETYMVGYLKKQHYKQRCHDPCHLKTVRNEIVGSPELIDCAAMNTNGVCILCSCRYQIHMHIYYETETFEIKLEDDTVKSNIRTKEAAYRTALDLTKKIPKRLSEYKEEKDFITKTTAKFACFLKTHAIAPYNDAYKSYIEYLIDREKSMSDAIDLELIKQLEKMILQYTEEKDIILKAIGQSGNSNPNISADDVISSIESLYSLQHSGAKIKELFQAQNRAHKDDNRRMKEFVFGSEDNVQKAGRFGPGKTRRGPRSRYSRQATPEPSQSQVESDCSNRDQEEPRPMNRSDSRPQDNVQNASRFSRGKNRGGPRSWHSRSSTPQSQVESDCSNQDKKERIHKKFVSRPTAMGEFQSWSFGQAKVETGSSNQEEPRKRKFVYRARAMDKFQPWSLTQAKVETESSNQDQEEQTSSSSRSQVIHNIKPIRYDSSDSES